MGCRGRSAASASCGRSTGWACRTGSSITRRSFQAASSSGSRSRARSSAILRSCSPTSRPETSIRRTATPSCGCSTSCTPTGRRSAWSPTIPASRNAPSGGSRCSTARWWTRRRWKSCARTRVCARWGTDASHRRFPVARAARVLPGRGERMSTIIDDLRFARRALRKRPGFVAAAVLTLALGIGANTAIFSVINAFMLKPLPYPDGERLVEVHNTYPGIGLENAGTSIPDYLARREQADAVEDLALFTWNSFNLASVGPPERLRGLTATPSLFSTLRVAPFLGRAFGDDEAVIGNDKVVVLG